jgi:hypothetical protein
MANAVFVDPSFSRCSNFYNSWVAQTIYLYGYILSSFWPTEYIAS